MADAMAALAMALRAAPTSIALPKRKGEGGLLSEAETRHEMKFIESTWKTKAKTQSKQINEMSMR